MLFLGDQSGDTTITEVRHSKHSINQDFDKEAELIEKAGDVKAQKKEHEDEQDVVKFKTFY